MNTESEEERKNFFIEKEESDQLLWQKIQDLSASTARRQLEAVCLILDNYSVVPDQADDLLLTLVRSDHPITVRREIAKRLAAGPRIRWTLHLKLLEILSKDKDKEVLKNVEPLWASYKKVYESLLPKVSALSDLYKSMLPTDFVDKLSKLAEIRVPQTFIDTIKQQTASILPTVILPLADQMKNTDLQRLSKLYSDSLIALRIGQENLFKNALRAVPSYSYYPVGQEIVETKVGEVPLISKLRRVPPGIEHWHEYQVVCGEILTSCFVPPLLEPFEESRTEVGIHRRDIIYPIPAGISSFWGYVQTSFSAQAVIVDAKNYADELPKDQVVMVSKYFGAKKLGNFGIIISRRGPSDAARKEQIDRWVHHDEMIICLSDDDLENMMIARQVDKAEGILEKYIFDIRKSA